MDQWAGAAGVRNVQWIRMLTEINTSIEGLQAVFNVEGEPPRVLRAENVGQYLDDARTLEMAEEDAPSLINIHVWGRTKATGTWVTVTQLKAVGWLHALLHKHPVCSGL